ncbi:hypothetical protein MTR67_019907 [Solanum verrucosum]|uniref:Uncharacterized protein n=1 Tax=Solanum verrucosum TaxID=315347 RepID=A0AAF0QPL2_SOLVR|nr:hypothetical protein MTR67_019907 [Solanum verrucosum]
MLILVTCVCIIKCCRLNNINTLNVRVCEGKTKHNISLKGTLILALLN